MTQENVRQPVVKEEEEVEETDGVTLIDTINVFNELSCLTVLWKARHHWPSGARFALNCYQHEA